MYECALHACNLMARTNQVALVGKDRQHAALHHIYVRGALVARRGGILQG